MKRASGSLQAGFHIWIILVIVAVVAIIGLLIWRFTANGGDPLGQVFGGGKFGAEYNCKERDVAFTSPPMKMEDLGYIRPLGAMLDGHVTPTDHVYVGPVDQDVPDNTYPVLMPADGTVVAVGRMPDQYIGDREGTQLPQEDHRITIMFSCRYFSIYIHIHKLAPEVAKAVEGIAAGENRQVSIDLKAGDTVGYIGGSTFDWTPIDTSKELSGFITPDLYKRESWKIHTVSPFDLYTGDLKAQLEAKSWRKIAPIGGKIDYDEPGKLIGNWFREGTNGYEGANQERYWDGHLSVVPDYIDPTYTVVSIGSWDGKATQMMVAGKVDPANVSTETGIVKWELHSFSYTDGSNSWNGSKPSGTVTPHVNDTVMGTIVFEVLPDEKLKVEKFVGKTPNQVTGFTSAAQIYER